MSEVCDLDRRERAESIIDSIVDLERQALGRDRYQRVLIDSEISTLLGRLYEIDERLGDLSGSDLINPDFSVGNFLDSLGL